MKTHMKLAALIIVISSAAIAGCSGNYHYSPLVDEKAYYPENRHSLDVSGGRDYKPNALIAQKYANNMQGRHPNGADRFRLAMEDIAKQLQVNMKQRHPWDTTVALTSFVSVDRFGNTSAFGRLCTEQMMTELMKMGFSVIEPRRADKYAIVHDKGEFNLSRRPEDIGEKFNVNGIVVGTYALSDGQAVINVRLVNPADNTLMSMGSAAIEVSGDFFLERLFADDGQASTPDQIQLARLISEGDSSELMLQKKIGQLAAQVGYKINRTLSAPAGARIVITTFVDGGDMNRTNPFGRYVAEKLMTELTRMGFGVIEMRLRKDIEVSPRFGETALSNEPDAVNMPVEADLVVAGTYVKSGDKATVSARLIESPGGNVVTAGSVIVDAPEKDKFMAGLFEGALEKASSSSVIEGMY